MFVKICVASISQNIIDSSTQNCWSAHTFELERIRNKEKCGDICHGFW